MFTCAFTRKHFLLLILVLSLFFTLVGCEVDQAADQVDNPIESTQNEKEVSKEQKDTRPKESDATNTSGTDPPDSPIPNGELIVHYIDVGQGDATLLQGPDFTILIDAGKHNRNDVVSYLRDQGIQTLDLAIGTHPHADHIGQMDKVIENFEVKEVWMSGDEHTSQTFERVIDTILASNADYHEPRAGEVYTFGSAVLEVVNPDRLTGNFHEGSVSVRVVYGDIKFLFTGDAEHHTEQAILNRGHNVKAHIFQLGHHGSSTSNTQSFLEAILPEVTIYSAGEGNSYGHPHDEVINRIQEMGITIYGTDVHGTIMIKTDGKTYKVIAQKSEVTADSSKEESVETQKEPAHDCIDINKASKSELIQIIHIGDARAEKLIELRPFHSIDDLTRISGIGPSRLSDIKEQGLACIN
jgi:competence protein ComEC